ncbi:hypothetical protein GYMLUDRAFT_52989 [Collybiopsis luxurians FD-317 M1]|nr:hypothetical protein GYMLUDRAFT_52989 [Collybiopsis luxurians FD-317 M1]
MYSPFPASSGPSNAVDGEEEAAGMERDGAATADKAAEIEKDGVVGTKDNEKEQGRGERAMEEDDLNVLFAQQATVQKWLKQLNSHDAPCKKPAHKFYMSLPEFASKIDKEYCSQYGTEDDSDDSEKHAKRPSVGPDGKVDELQEGKEREDLDEDPDEDDRKMDSFWKKALACKVQIAKELYEKESQEVKKELMKAAVEDFKTQTEHYQKALARKECFDPALLSE